MKCDVEYYVFYNVFQCFVNFGIGIFIVMVEFYIDELVSQMCKIIVCCLVEFKFIVLYFYLIIFLDMDNVIVVWKVMNVKEGVKVFFNDMVIKVVVMVLKSYLNVNSLWMGDFICCNYYVNIGVVVVVDEGLFVLVICFVDIKGML